MQVIAWLIVIGVVGVFVWYEGHDYKYRARLKCGVCKHAYTMSGKSPGHAKERTMALHAAHCSSTRFRVEKL